MKAPLAVQPTVSLAISPSETKTVLRFRSRDAPFSIQVRYGCDGDDCRRRSRQCAYRSR
jgi:hypothetical protein